MRSIIDPRLASHVTREAEKFLSIIDRLEQRLEKQRQSGREVALGGGVKVEIVSMINTQTVNVVYNVMLAHSGAPSVYLHLGFG